VDMPLLCVSGRKVRAGLFVASAVGVGYAAAFFVAEFWKKLERDGFWGAGGSFEEVPFGGASGDVLPSVKMKVSHEESMWAFISLGRTFALQIGQSIIFQSYRIEQHLRRRCWSPWQAM